jgi:hypothetical protein
LTDFSEEGSPLSSSVQSIICFALKVEATRSSETFGKLCDFASQKKIVFSQRGFIFQRKKSRLLIAFFVPWYSFVCEQFSY